MQCLFTKNKNHHHKDNMSMHITISDSARREALTGSGLGRHPIVLEELLFIAAFQPNQTATSEIEHISVQKR